MEWSPSGFKVAVFLLPFSFFSFLCLSFYSYLGRSEQRPHVHCGGVQHGGGPALRLHALQQHGRRGGLGQVSCNWWIAGHVITILTSDWSPSQAKHQVRPDVQQEGLRPLVRGGGHGGGGVCRGQGQPRGPGEGLRGADHGGQ